MIKYRRGLAYRFAGDWFLRIRAEKALFALNKVHLSDRGLTFYGLLTDDMLAFRPILTADEVAVYDLNKKEEDKAAADANEFTQKMNAEAAQYEREEEKKIAEVFDGAGIDYANLYKSDQEVQALTKVTDDCHVLTTHTADFEKSSTCYTVERNLWDT